jgi:hypothetical protein
MNPGGADHHSGGTEERPFTVVYGQLNSIGSLMWRTAGTGRERVDVGDLDHPDPGILKR